MHRRSVIGTLHLPWWLDRPGVDPVSLIEGFGVPGAVSLQLAGLGAIALWVDRIERKAHGNVERGEWNFRSGDKGLLRPFLTGRWPFFWAIGVLALGSVLTLVIGGSTVGHHLRLWPVGRLVHRHATDGTITPRQYRGVIVLPGDVSAQTHSFLLR